MIFAEDDKDLEDELTTFIKDTNFPCVGAKAALAHGTLRTVVCLAITSTWDDLRIHNELMQWAADYRDDPGLFRSLAFVFKEVTDLTEEAFELAMWDRLQSLADKDAWLDFPYDRRVSSNPQDPHFSLSFGAEAYFVVGLHPNASRPARRFSHPVLVFNIRDQFERLRAEGRYETIRAKILQRDEQLAGSINPMLARHGEASEAAQYSGRQVGKDWLCPFHDPRSEI
jgi:uncharacterized protein